MFSFSLSQDTAEVAGPVFLRTQSTISFSFLPPLYSTWLPCLNLYKIKLLEEVEGGEATDAESLGKFFISGGIDLSQVIWRVIFSEPLSCFSIFWGQLLAVAAIPVTRKYLTTKERKIQPAGTRFWRVLHRSCRL